MEPPGQQSGPRGYYGLACSDTGDPCTQDGDCLTGTCDPIDDEFWLETNGHVEASARYAGYTQLFGYYTDACVAVNRWNSLM